GHVRFKSGQLQMARMVAGEPVKIAYVDLQEPHVRWTPALRKLLMRPNTETPEVPPAPDKGATPENGTAAKKSGGGLELGRATLTKADVWLKDPQLMSFFLETKGALKVDQLLLDGAGWHSTKLQSLEVTQGRLIFPPGADGVSPKPWLELPRGELAMTPNEWNATKRVEKLVLENAVVRMREGNTPWLPSTDPPLVGPPFPVPDTQPKPEPEPAVASSPPAPEPAEKPAGPPWWQQLQFGELRVQDVAVDMLGNLPKPLELKGVVSIQTEKLDGGGQQQRLKVGNFNANLPTLSRLPFPVAQASSFEAVVKLPQVWQERRLEELKLTGATVDASEALLGLFEKEPTADLIEEPAKPATPKPKSPAVKDERPWHVGKMEVGESSVTISNLVPGLSSVKFGVEFKAEDAPLTPEGLSTNVAPQRIELANLRVPSPYEPLRSVAELDSIFLSFTLGGLMRKEIDKVEIVSPTLYVGEDLFWYVDYYRKYVMEGAKPAMNAPMVVANDDPALDLAAAEAVQEAEPPTSQAAWSIKTLQVHGGKLVVAPKGIPLKGFRDPFPFNINTQVTRGTLEAELDIPQGTYEIPTLDLQLVGMKGHVKFNLPMKQRDNNLVETFEVDSIRWKGLLTGKAFLSVTYDSAGIYAQFGAEAYEGYVNGQANVYLDDSFHWDGWIGGKKVQTHELTKVLCPGYFILDGKVEATLVAQGSKDELYQADGSFKNHSPGKFTIKALTGLIDDLPKEWALLQRKLTQIGLETLRDFEYDQAEAKCRFYGREGNGTVRFSGPNGSRNFDINVYDHRWTTDKPEAGNAETPTATITIEE
ncbi:MAG TPA: hypothetical protein VK956_07915, partial [Verrucomicrobium sp.]|nr:hypothetical protein [Verrucomicrobium sp.]